MDLHFKEYGAGAPVVILHGLFGSLNNWHSHATALGERFHVFTLDQRNHGSSGHSPEMNYALMADDLHEFIRKHGIAPAMVVGHSMGGRTAMQHALTFPDEVQKVVVVDMHPHADPPVHIPIFNALSSVDFSRVGSRDDVERMLAPSITDSAVLQLLLTNLKREENGSYRWKISLEGIRNNYDALIGPVTVDGRFEGPSLFLTGGKSTLVKPSDHPGILSLFPRAEFVEIPEAGHWVQADAPEEFRSVVMEFLLS
jgi:esterase